MLMLMLLFPKTVFWNNWARPTKTGIFESNASIIRFGGKITDLTKSITNINITRIRLKFGFAIVIFIIFVIV